MNTGTGQQRAGTIAQLGEIYQLAFVPADFDGMLRYWTQVIGAGPFFLLEHVRTENFKYRGQPAALDFTAALGYWNDMQIELIKQHDATPSIFSAWREQGRDGLHHVAMFVDDIQHARHACAAAGGSVAQEMEAGGGTSKIIYADTGGPGPLIEMVQAEQSRINSFFAPMRKAARNWDGSNPIRRL